MKIAICDDNEIDRGIVENQIRACLLEKYISHEIELYGSGEQLLASVHCGNQFDFIFLDMYMDKLSGMDTARFLRNFGYGEKLIFLTATDRFAVESYDVNADGYIIKPPSPIKIRMLFDKFSADCNSDAYSVKNRNNIIYIPYNDIEYIESNNSKCVLHHVDGRLYNIYKKLADIEAELDGKSFLRCHQSYIINMSKVRTMTDYFRLHSGTIIPIRIRNINDIRKAYLDYIAINGKNLDKTPISLASFYKNIGGDINEVSKRLFGEANVHRFAKKFIYDNSFTELSNALQDGDFELAYRSAHTLKGVSANLGFSQLYEASSIFTETLRSKDMHDEYLLQEQFGDISREYQLVIDNLSLMD